MEQQPELISPEAVATEPVGETRALEVVDPLFGRAALHVPVVEGQRRIGTRSDDEAQVGTLIEDLGLVDDAPLVRLGACGIADLARQTHLRAGLRVLPPSGFQQRLSGGG